MKEIGAVTIGKLIEAHYEKDECKFKSYAEFIAEAYKERGEERAERIIRSKIDGSYKNKPVVVTLDKERKEELKDEMKNRISLALKDPILQQGFEIICKEIVELKADNDARKFAMAMSEKVEKQLREENAELKEKLKPENCLKLLAKEGYIKFTSEQLTKAKEIIEGLMRFCRCFAQHHTEDIRYKDAEQFLKDCEVK